MPEIFTLSLFASTIRLATPYLLAGLGETLAQRSGVLNLGLDGMMLLSAFSAFYVVHRTGDLMLGLLAAIVTGALMGLAAAFVNVTLKAKQGISGIGFYLFGLGMSDLLFQTLIGTPKTVSGFPRIALPGLSSLPVVGDVLFNHNALVYLAFALVPVMWFVLNKTNFGLMVRAVGQTPEAADAMGISVARVRYLTVIIGGILAGLAGASLSIALINTFQQNLTGGLGFIAVALVYFGGWRPVGILLGSLLFSFVNALQLQISVVGLNIPSEFAVMSPYVITLVVLIFASKRRDKPDALTKPFQRGEG
ncbi:MAG: ABC transporter permease [Anaerolineae bacterium]|jgi:simple sugar transport system permease protein|nr:ABC transporter permease [Anaerolineae bacterium]